MSLPAPYTQVDDAGLAEACIAEDEHAWSELGRRHGALLEAVAVRVLDERRPGDAVDLPAIVERIDEYLRRNQAGPLRTWDPATSLRHYLAVLARQVAESYLQDATPTAALVSSMPTPAAFQVDDVTNGAEADEVAGVLERLNPHVTAVLRLRMRGVSAPGIAAVLGMQQHAVTAHLERIASRLAAEQNDPTGSADAIWRALIDCASLSERTEIAIRTEDDPSFAALRARIEGIWRAVRDRTLQRLELAPKPPWLDEKTVATFVDGTLRGPERARVEGGLATSVRCIDMVAMLVLDMQATDILRAATHLARPVALAAACAAAYRFRISETLAASAPSSARAPELLRLSRVGQRLVGGRSSSSPPLELSGVVPSPAVPSDEEAPLVALDALLAKDLHGAYRAIDDHLAKQTIGGRLRLLAAAAGHDLPEAAQLASGILARTSADPGLRGDARVVTSLPPGRTLPRELLTERLRDAIPEVVRFLVSR